MDSILCQLITYTNQIKLKNLNISHSWSDQNKLLLAHTFHTVISTYKFPHIKLKSIDMLAGHFDLYITLFNNLDSEKSDVLFTHYRLQFMSMFFRLLSLLN